MTEYDADVEHLAQYFLGDPPFRAATVDEHERRIRSLAAAIQRTIDAWLASHPLEGPERRRWARVLERRKA